MNEAARRAGLPLEQWLQERLLGHLGTGAQAGAGGDIADLRRRLDALIGLGLRQQAETSGQADTSPDLLRDPVLGASSRAARESRPLDARFDAVMEDVRVQLGETVAGAGRRARAAGDQFERRMDEIVRSAEAIGRRTATARAPSPPQTSAPSMPSPLTPAGIEAAVAQIAARQRELDAPPANAAPEVAAPDLITPQPAAPEPIPPEPTSPRAPKSSAPKSPPPLRPAMPRPAAPAAAERDALAALGTEIAELRAGLAQLAPRETVTELQHMVLRLAERVERAGIDNSELCATLAALRDMIGTLRLPEHHSVVLGRLDALSRRLDLVAAKQVDGAAIIRLQAQAGEIRDLIGKALSNDAVRQLVEQVTLLVGKVGRMGGVDEALMRQLIGGLDDKLGMMMQRLESQLARPVEVPLDEVYRRLDTIQADIATVRHAAPSGVEALLKDLGERIGRMERPSVAAADTAAIEALSRQITAMADRLEAQNQTRDRAMEIAETLAQQIPAGERPPAARLAGIERALGDLFIQIEETRATLLDAALRPPEPPAGPGRTQGGADAPDAPAPAPANDARPAPARATLADTDLGRISGERVERRQPPAGEAAPSAALFAEAPGLRLPPAARPVPEDPAAPPRVDFIAQARRASAQGSTAAGLPGGRLAQGRSARDRSTRVLARLRAMLLIGIGGSALAFGCWHLLAGLKGGELRASLPFLSKTARTPATAPLPEDITGSVPERQPGPGQAGPTPAGPAPDAPAGTAPQAPLPGSSSLDLPAGTLPPGDLPAAIGSTELRAAALAGDSAAAFEIARRYLDGTGLSASPARAAEWFAFASARGSVLAAYRLGALYEKGAEGVPRDVARARASYEIAATGGNVRAMHNLGVLLASGNVGPADYAEAAQWFRKAADHGVRDSQFNLGVLYTRGFGVPVDPAAAYLWFSLAAARGDTEAATRRDQVAARLDAAALAEARQTAQQWSPQIVDAKANGGEAEWDRATGARKTVSRL